MLRGIYSRIIITMVPEASPRYKPTFTGKEKPTGISKPERIARGYYLIELHIIIWFIVQFKSQKTSS